MLDSLSININIMIDLNNIIAHRTKLKTKSKLLHKYKQTNNKIILNI